MEARIWTAATIATTALWPIVLWRHWPAHGALIALAALLVADAGSYIFHYVVDWYGDADRPGLPREFQLHHAEPHGIAHALLLDVLLPAARLVVPAWAAGAVCAALGIIPPPLALAFAVTGAAWCYGQLFHRWAHMRTPPRLVRQLQRLGLIVRPGQHRLHHIPPHGSHYAVVTGWSNPLLDGLGAPRLIDRLLRRFGIEKKT